MGLFVEEVKVWNTPLIGAFLLWKFTNGYKQAHPNGDAPVALLHFIAFGVLSSNDLLEPINNHRDNLQSYARHFENQKQIDLLLGLQERIRAKLPATLEALDVAIATGLLVWDTQTAKIHSRDIVQKPSRGNNLNAYANKIGAKAEILGRWFSEHDLAITLNYLKVRV